MQGASASSPHYFTPAFIEVHQGDLGRDWGGRRGFLPMLLPAPRRCGRCLFADLAVRPFRSRLTQLHCKIGIIMMYMYTVHAYLLYCTD